jgi:DNA-binding response OmpR family regulator
LKTKAKEDIVEKKSVLLVEDDRDFLEAVKTVYEHHNFNVIEAYDGETALSKIQKHKPDLAVLDVMLPKKDGYAVCFEIKHNETTADIPVIILTSLGGKNRGKDGAEIMATGHGADLFLEKPVKPQLLVEKSTELLEKIQTEEKGKTRILIIDDDVDFTEAITAILENRNYKVISTATGEEGIVTAGKVKPDLILVDVMLPEMDGYAVCKHLKENPETQSIPVVMLTAVGSKLTEPGYAEAIAVTHKADDYIQKPVKADELIKRIQNLVGPSRRLI